MNQFAILLVVKCVHFFVNFVGSHCQNKHFTLVALECIIGVKYNWVLQKWHLVGAFITPTEAERKSCMIADLTFFSTKHLLLDCIKWNLPKDTVGVAFRTLRVCFYKS